MSIESNKLMNLADGKVLYDDLRGRVESVVDVSDTTPSAAAQIWFPETPPSSVQVPTVSEMQAMIDDTAGNGDTDKVWSADKVYNELADKFDKASTSLSNVQDGIAYRLGNTNTTGSTLAVGTYVYVTGNTNSVADGMYKVTTAISANGSLTTSNLGAVSGGGLNALNTAINNGVLGTQSFSSLSTFKTFLANMTTGKSVNIITSSEVSTAICGSSYICSGVATKIESDFVDINWVRGESAAGSSRYKISTQTFSVNDLNSNIATVDGKLILSLITSLQVIEDTSHNLLILRGNYEGTGNFLQLVANGSTKQLTINKSVNGTETTLATFQGT